MCVRVWVRECVCICVRARVCVYECVTTYFIRKSEHTSLNGSCCIICNMWIYNCGNQLVTMYLPMLLHETVIIGIKRSVNNIFVYLSLLRLIAEIGYSVD